MPGRQGLRGIGRFATSWPCLSVPTALTLAMLFPMGLLGKVPPVHQNVAWSALALAAVTTAVVFAVGNRRRTDLARTGRGAVAAYVGMPASEHWAGCRTWRHRHVHRRHGVPGKYSLRLRQSRWAGRCARNHVAPARTAKHKFRRLTGTCTSIATSPHICDNLTQRSSMPLRS